MKVKYKELRFVNIGEATSKQMTYWKITRDWDNCVKYNFISAGGGARYSDPFKELKKGDIIAAYISQTGYVGIGIVTSEAVHVTEFQISDGTKMSELINKKGDNYLWKYAFTKNGSKDITNAEYIVGVKWFKTVDREHALWAGKQLFSNSRTQCKIKKQVDLMTFALGKKFNIEFIKTH